MCELSDESKQMIVNTQRASIPTPNGRVFIRQTTGEMVSKSTARSVWTSSQLSQATGGDGGSSAGAGLIKWCRQSALDDDIQLMYKVLFYQGDAGASHTYFSASKGRPARDEQPLSPRTLARNMEVRDTPPEACLFNRHNIQVVSGDQHENGEDNTRISSSESTERLQTVSDMETLVRASEMKGAVGCSLVSYC